MAKFQYVSDVICLWAIFFAVGVFTGLQARYFRVMNFSVCVSFGLGMYANAIVVVNNGPIIWTILLSAGAGATMQIVASTGWAFLERGAFLFLSFVSLFLIRALSIATANPMRAPGSLRNLTNGIAGLGFAPIGVTDLTNFLSEIGAFVLAISGIIGAWWMIVARRGYVF